ncbi:hypothetical protein [Streptomyces mirabilis]|uniref:hypothetical protein n=1 Tax=Streptomyces mirabilis TaxID=68239 RepID=UPI0033165974
MRPPLCGYAYHLAGFTGFNRLGHFDRLALACRVFGRRLVEAEIGQVRTVLNGWGYQYGQDHDKGVPSVMSQLFLLNRSPHSSDLTNVLFDRVRREDLLTDGGTRVLFAVQRAVAALGYCEAPSLRSTSERAGHAGVSATWGAWVERWTATTTMTHRPRLNSRAALLKAGRWVADQQPEAADPAEWTRQTCAAWIAAVDQMKIGDYVVRTSSFQERIGQPLQAGSKAGLIRAVRVFFRDIQDWEWLPRRFDPQRALALPRSINALIGPQPRVIADDVWAKLLWAGLNLEAHDVPRGKAGPVYPVELVRAVTLTWLFMACARCDFYVPKDSSKGQLLEAKKNLQKMLANIPLTDDERVAVDDGQAALDQLLQRLTDVPTPAGRTPRQLGAPATATLLPIVEVRNGPTP